MKRLLSFLFVILLSAGYAQENVSYMWKKDRNVTWYADVDAGTTIMGGFALGVDVQAVYKKNVFALFSTNNLTAFDGGFKFNPYSSGGTGLIITTTDLNSFQFGLGYGRLFEYERFQLAGYVGPSYLILKSENVFTLYGSVSPTFFILPNMNIGLNIYGMITDTAPPAGVMIRTRYVLNNRRLYLSKEQRDNLPQ